MSSHDHGHHAHPPAHAHGAHADALYAVGPAPTGRFGKVLLAWALVALFLTIAATVVLGSILMTSPSFFGAAAK